jgi:CRP-like cAMP-binding protein
VVQGHLATSLFLVGEGEVRLRREDGTDWRVATLGLGDVVSDMALLTGEPWTATVRAVDETVVFEVCRAQYEPLVQDHPEWLEELGRIMEERQAAMAAGAAAPPRAQCSTACAAASSVEPHPRNAAGTRRSSAGWVPANGLGRRARRKVRTVARGPSSASRSAAVACA